MKITCLFSLKTSEGCWMQFKVKEQESKHDCFFVIQSEIIRNPAASLSYLLAYVLERGRISRQNILYIPVCKCIYVFMYACMYDPIRMWVRMSVCRSVCICICMSVYLGVYVCVWMYACRCNREKCLFKPLRFFPSTIPHTLRSPHLCHSIAMAHATFDQTRKVSHSWTLVAWNAR